MTNDGGITWDNVAAMYNRMGEDWNKPPRAVQIRMTKEYANNLLTEIPQYDDYSNPSAYFLMGIPIIADDKLIYGEWRVFDQYGNTLEECLFPAQDWHVAMHNLLYGEWHIPFRTNMLGKWPIGKFGFDG